MNLNELLTGCRTYRRFVQEPIDKSIICEALENARIGSSGANAQPLYYYAVISPDKVKAMQPLVKSCGAWYAQRTGTADSIYCGCQKSESNPLLGCGRGDCRQHDCSHCLEPWSRKLYYGSYRW